LIDWMLATAFISTPAFSTPATSDYAFQP